MNTVKSVYYGWGVLIAAGGGAYYFAKQEINADRAAKAEVDRQKRIKVWQMEQARLDGDNPDHVSQTAQLLSADSPSGSRAGAGSGIAGSPGHGGGAAESGNPSLQANQDPAPTRHEPDGARSGDKSKYEASDVYRSRKGDRFS